MDEIKLIPCVKCGGLPVEMIQPGWPYPTVRVVCSVCGQRGPIVYYAQKDVLYSGQDLYNRYLLPGLPRARREAAAAWNEGTCGSGGGASG